MGHSTIDSVTGVWRASLSALVGTIQPQSYTRRVTLMSINCPDRATLKIYRGYTPTLPGQVTSLANANGRTYTAEGGQPIVIRAGEPATFVWSGGNVTSTSSASAAVNSEVS